MFDLESIISKSLDKGLQSMKKAVDDRTPEDTKTLLGNNKIEGVIKEGDIYYGSVYNDTPYADYVEYGVRGKKYRYRKPKGSIFYTGVGARMYARAQLEKENEICNQIISEIEEAIISFNNDKGTEF